VYGEFSSLLLQNAAYDEAINVLQEGITRIPAQMQQDFWSRERLILELGVAYRHKADSYVVKNGFDLALENYLKALEYLETSEKYSVWEKIGDMYNKAGDHSKAIASYHQAIALYRKSNMGVSNYVVKELEQKIQGVLERN
jgi:tetratricopeptide (TPR) repeat protein